MTVNQLRLYRWKLLSIEPRGHNTNRVLYKVNMALYERTRNIIYLIGTKWKLSNL